MYAGREELDRFDALVSSSEIATLSCNGFLGNSDLARMEQLLRSSLPATSRGGVLLDLGCGRAGLGRALAWRLSLRLVGVDFSAVALAQARRDGQPDDLLVCADFAKLGLATGGVTAAVSLDALYLAPDPELALAEVGRVCAPNAPLLFTICYDATAALALWRAILDASGFAVAIEEDVTAEWHDGLRAKHMHRLHEADALRERVGAPAAEHALATSRFLLGDDKHPGMLFTRSRSRVLALRRGE